MKSREEFFKELNNKEYYKSLLEFLDEEYKTKVIFPCKNDIFKAFQLTPVKDIKVVIIGQDPYSNPNEAMGLAFSVNEGNKLPPSLRNIYKEIENEFNETLDYTSGDLTYLAKQGVLLLNAYLTVVAHQPLSHKKKEYEFLFKDILSFLNSLDEPIVFMLWGNNARKYKKYLNSNKHLIIETAHPSPLSANQGNWFNNGCFVKCNNYLEENNIKTIEWSNKKTLS